MSDERCCTKLNALAMYLHLQMYVCDNVIHACIPE